GGRKAAGYLVEQFRALKLEPLFDDGYTQDIPDRQTGQILGRNVGARLVGFDPDLRDEWIVVSAHYDHLGMRDRVVSPGAYDNAVGGAMLLEDTSCLSEMTKLPRRILMFLSCDMEEIGLWGSLYFAEHSPVPFDRIKLCVTADMISRSLGGVCDDKVFVFGS